MHNEEHLNLVLIMEYFGIICECDIQLTEPNANKKEINATKKRIKNDAIRTSKCLQVIPKMSVSLKREILFYFFYKVRYRKKD